MAIEYGRLETTAVGAGSSAGQVDPHRVAPHDRDVRERSASVRERAASPASSSITCRCATRGRDPLGQRPLPSPDLERHVARIECGVADDRLQQVRVGQEVLAQASPPAAALTNRKTLAAFASTICSSSSYRERRARRARTSATSTTLAGWFGLPRTDCGARNGESVSTSSSSSGTSRAVSRRSSALGIGDVAGERAVPAPLGGLADPRRAAPSSNGGSR